VRPAHFNRRSWRELQQHFKSVASVAARLTQKSAPNGNTTLFATIAARRAQTGMSTRQVVVQLVREMRAAKQERGETHVPSNTCPYCGGAYTLDRSCYGPRTDDPDANTCKRMRKHRRLVQDAADAERSESDEVSRV
jgi:hypothetical protein